MELNHLPGKDSMEGKGDIERPEYSKRSGVGKALKKAFSTLYVHTYNISRSLDAAYIRPTEDRPL